MSFIIITCGLEFRMFFSSNRYKIHIIGNLEVLKIRTKKNSFNEIENVNYRYEIFYGNRNLPENL